MSFNHNSVILSERLPATTGRSGHNFSVQFPQKPHRTSLESGEYPTKRSMTRRTSDRVRCNRQKKRSVDSRLAKAQLIPEALPADESGLRRTAEIHREGADGARPSSY